MLRHTTEHTSSPSMSTKNHMRPYEKQQNTRIGLFYALVFFVFSALASLEASIDESKGHNSEHVFVREDAALPQPEIEESFLDYAHRTNLQNYGLQLYDLEYCLAISSCLPDDISLSDIIDQYGTKQTMTTTAFTAGLAFAYPLSGYSPKTAALGYSVLQKLWLRLSQSSQFAGWLLLGGSAIVVAAYHSIIQDDSSSLLDEQNSLFTNTYSAESSSPSPKQSPILTPIIPAEEIEYGPMKHEQMQIKITAQDKASLKVIASVLERYHASHEPNFLKKIGKKTLSYYLNYLDTTKSFFLQQDIDMIYILFADTWLENIIHRQDYIALTFIHNIRHQRIHEAMHYLRNLPNKNEQDAESAKLTYSFANHPQNTEEWKQRLRNKDRLTKILLSKIYNQETNVDSSHPQSFMLLGKMYHPPSYAPAAIDIFVQSVFRNFGNFTRWDTTFFKWNPWSRGHGLRFYIDDAFIFSLSPHEGIFTIEEVAVDFIHNQKNLSVGDRVIGLRINKEGESFLPLYPFPGYFSETFVLRNIINHKFHQNTSHTGKILYYLYVLKHDADLEHYYILEVPIELHQNNKKIMKQKRLTHRSSKARFYSAQPKDSNTPSRGQSLYIKPPILDASYYLTEQENRKRSRLSFAHPKPSIALARERISEEIYKLQNAIEQAHKHLQNNALDGIILDLRDNYGDLWITEILTPFMRSTYGINPRLKKGEFAPSLTRLQRYQQIIGNLLKYRQATTKKFTYDGPLVVLVNHNTTGVAEFIAQEIKAHGRGIIIGTTNQTSGHGTINRFYTIDRRGNLRESAVSSSLCLAVYQCYASDGSSIHGNGVLADIIVPSISAAYFSKKFKSFDQSAAFPNPAPNQIKPLSIDSHDLRSQEIIDSLKVSSNLFIQNHDLINQTQKWAEQYRNATKIKYVSLNDADWTYISHHDFQNKKRANATTDSSFLTRQNPISPPQKAEGDIVLYQATFLLGRYAQLLKQSAEYHTRPKVKEWNTY